MPIRSTLVRLLGVLIVSLVCLSCKDSGTEPVVRPLTSMSGRIENWSMGDTLVIRANYHYFDYHSHTYRLTSAGESNIDQSGNFSIPLGELPDSALALYGWIFGGVIITDTTAGTASMSYLSVYPKNSLNVESNILGSVSNEGGRDTATINLSITYIYSNKPFHLGGDSTVITRAGDTLRVIIDLNFQLGWNKQVVRTIFREIHKSVLTVFVEEMTTAKWYFYRRTSGVQEMNSKPRISHTPHVD